MEVDALSEDTVTAWCESVNGGTRVGVQRWKESQAPVSMPLPTRPGSVFNPALVVQRSGNPVVAWSETGAIQVHRWTGTAWEQLGQPLPTSPTFPEQPETTLPVLALDGSGQLLVAWGRPGMAELWQWTESGWRRLRVISRPSLQTDLPGPLSLQVDAAGVPVLAWSRQATNSALGLVEVFRLNR
jgi:hypothetical protein